MPLSPTHLIQTISKSHWIYFPSIFRAQPRDPCSWHSLVVQATTISCPDHCSSLWISLFGPSLAPLESIFKAETSMILLTTPLLEPLLLFSENQSLYNGLKGPPWSATLHTSLIQVFYVSHPHSTLFSFLSPQHPSLPLPQSWYWYPLDTPWISMLPKSLEILSFALFYLCIHRKLGSVEGRAENYGPS